MSAEETGLLFYQILRHPTKFAWIEEAIKDFQNLKKYLSSSPLLVTPLVDETLYLYLAITPRVVSFVLYSKHDNTMKYVYYVNCVLNGPEECYSSLEKHILCLVITA